MAVVDSVAVSFAIESTNVMLLPVSTMYPLQQQLNGN